MEVFYTAPNGTHFVIHVDDKGCVTGVTSDAYTGDPTGGTGVTYDRCQTVEFIKTVLDQLPKP